MVLSLLEQPVDHACLAGLGSGRAPPPGADRSDDLGRADQGGGPQEQVAPGGAARALHQGAPLQGEHDVHQVVGGCAGARYQCAR